MSSLLETFAILFESDAEEVKKGAETAEKSVDDLEHKIQDTDKTSKKLGESFVDLVDSSKSAILGILSFGAISAGLVSLASQTSDIGQFSRALDYNVGEIDAWDEAVIRFNGTAQGSQASIKGLTNQLTDLGITGGGAAAEVFARLGLSAFNFSGNVKSAFDILPEIADVFQSLSKRESTYFGEKLGFDQGTILLLQQGRRAVEALVRQQKELGTVTEKDTEQSIEFNNAWSDFEKIISNAGRTTNSVFLPVLTKSLNLIKDFTAFLKENEDLATGLFIGIAGAITVFFLPAIASAIVAIAPFALVAATIAAIGFAFALVYEDIQNFIAGNDSLIGQFFKKYPKIEASIGKVGKAFQTLGKEVSGALDDILKIPTDTETSFKNLTVKLIRLWKATVGELLKFQLDLGKRIFESLPSSIAEAEIIFNKFKEFLKTLFVDVGGFLKKAFSGIEEGIKQEAPEVLEVGHTIANIGTFENVTKALGVPNIQRFGESTGYKNFGSGTTPIESGNSTETNENSYIENNYIEVGKGTEPINMEELIKGMEAGSQKIQDAQTNPLAAQSSSSISNSNSVQTSNRSTSVSVGNVNVDARGGNAKEIGANIVSELELTAQMSQATAAFDDGVAG